mgnify:CR=1 FL=1
MKIGDKFEWCNITYTIWLIVDGVVHGLAEDGSGICVEEEILKNN